MLRGNSASGKSSVAAGLCDRFGRGLALVGQDNLRRIVLRERDRAGAADIGLIGILYAGPYGAMLAQLRADHLGPNRGYYLDVPFAETLARHATKPIVNDAGEEALRDWYRERDVLPSGVETVIGADSQIVSRSQLRACCHHRATTECASAKHPLRLRSGPHRPPRGPGRNADAGCVPGDRKGPALLPPGRGDLRGEHPASGQPPPPHPGTSRTWTAGPCTSSATGP